MHRRLRHYEIKPDDAFGKAAEILGGLPFTRGNELTLLIDGEETFEALFASILSAEKYLLVNFFMNTRDRTETAPDLTMSDYYGYRAGIYSPWPRYWEDRTITYQVGTINVDIVDAEKKQLIWEGVAEGRVTEESLNNPKVTVNAVVTELMRRYPGRPGM